MTAQIFLSEEQADPTVLIGAALPAIGAAYRIGSDGNFIFEACEYKDSFLSFYPRIAVVLNVRLDHTDYFASLEQLKRSFRQFMNNAGDSGIALVNADAPDAVEAARDVLPQVRYFSVRDPAADYFAGSITYDGGFASFDIYAARCFAGIAVGHRQPTSPTRWRRRQAAPVGRQREGNARGCRNSAGSRGGLNTSAS
ncbi:MAG: Mur ligase family protein [Acutalibacteraceae bacterium]